MKKSIKKALFLVLFFVVSIFFAVSAHAEEKVQFKALAIIIDSDSLPLAAYQIELCVVSGQADIVGVEGGAHQAFKDAPHYDPRALMSGRIILAAFSTSSNLPTTATRLLTVHVREQSADVRYAIKVMAAADAKGQPIQIQTHIVDASEVK